jgi:hypothetical protein
MKQPRITREQLTALKRRHPGIEVFMTHGCGEAFPCPKRIRKRIPCNKRFIAMDCEVVNLKEENR